MSKPKYYIDHINKLSLNPGGLKRNLHKGDDIIIEVAELTRVESLLKKEGFTFTTSDSMPNAKLITIESTPK